MSRASDILDLANGRDAIVRDALTRMHRLAAAAERDASADELSEFAELRVEAHRHYAVAEVLGRYARVLAEGRYSIAQVIDIAEEHHRAGADAILSASHAENVIHEARFRGLAAGAKLAADSVREASLSVAARALPGALSA
jgi:hypothetical protein